jgi:hypothetical protein
MQCAALKIVFLLIKVPPHFVLDCIVNFTFVDGIVTSFLNVNIIKDADGQL